jgi:sortase (surface protein transpeptidase)
MKKVIISTILTAGILLAGNAQANYIDPVTESKLVKVCEAIKSDRVIKVNIAIRDSGIGIKQIANGLVCNGFDPVSFALINHAEKTAKFMAKRSNVNGQEFLAKL